MSQSDGKTASYLRGAAEEKSLLTDGSTKTTIDTIAGQTNTNITDGSNISNNLQKADQLASSVTDGTNTTVANQDAQSLASSITDGTKFNNTNSTVDKSEQLIKSSDTQYNASVKTATTTTERMVSGSIIDILKDADNGYINTTVTQGDNSTGVKQTSQDITQTAKQGTITNDAKNLVNTAEESMTNTAGTQIQDVVGNTTVTTTTEEPPLKMRTTTQLSVKNRLRKLPFPAIPSKQEKRPWTMPKSQRILPSAARPPRKTCM